MRILANNRMGLSLFAAVLVSMAALQGCGGTGIEADEAKEYELMSVATSDHKLSTEYPSQLKGRQDIRIVPRVEGYLKEIRVREGQKVREGQLLFVIDQTAYRAEVKSAEAGLELAKAQLSKAQLDVEAKQVLLEKKVVSEFDLKQTQSDLLVAQANLEAAKAALESAKNNLSFTELRSPSNGVVGRIPYRRGDYVGPTTTEGLTMVSDNEVMYVYFSLSERRVMEYVAAYGSMEKAISDMPELELVLSDGSRYESKGKIESISGIVDEQTGSVAVRAVFPNTKGMLLSGGTARVEMLQMKTDAIVIPQEAAFEVLDKTYVYAVKNGAAQATLIKVEQLNNGKEYVVLDGLKPGEVIIAKGASLVREGDRIKSKSDSQRQSAE